MTRALFTLLLICTTALSWGQNTAEQKKLEQQKNKLQKEIKEFQSLLSTQNKKEKSVLVQIKESEAKIRLTQNLINTIQKQSRLLTDNIYLNQKKANKLEKELEVLKEDYANTIVKSYKSRSDQSRIMFILSSENFLQAYKRIQYMKQYANFRKMQAEELKEKMAELEALLEKLKEQKKEKENLLAETEKQKKELEADKKGQDALVKVIQKDKKKYAADIKKRQQDEKKLEQQIQKLIREAIAEENRKRAKENGKSTANVSNTKIELTKEGKIISDNFKANKGQLPWPVERGYVSQPYGPYRGQADGVKVHSNFFNNGLDIATSKDADVRSVFGGEVTLVTHVGTFDKVYTVLVRHGSYVTSYTNLKSVNVVKGDKVGIKQTLGKVWTNEATGETVLKFYIIQDVSLLNPQQWLNPLK
ncbi:peptidase M23 [Flavobacterium beibuense F44-8]|uniref:Peptidase M23 n=1 Tax=Flavobacterium beibuense F44-8 TaxID=1406840 RepID=A0A0A2LSH5_9FLAO|nr:peptidoglycan DD-metalloendopeptidase family protein [Flavobacterium beibuense]KGO83277.1 peptidase M23 [Flavobacterium beibuense F44-8]